MMVVMMVVSGVVGQSLKNETCKNNNLVVQSAQQLELLDLDYNSSLLLFSMFTPYGGGWESNRDIIPALCVTLDSINNDPDLLSNYTLLVAIFDSRCAATNGLSSLLDVYTYIPENLGVIGCGCSTCSQPVSQLSHAIKSPIVSFASTSPTLSVTRDYPWFMRTVGPDTFIAQIWLRLALYYKWDRVVTVSSSEDVHFLTIKAFEQLAREHSIEVLASIVFESDDTVTEMQPKMEIIKELQGFIIFIAGYDAQAREFFIGAHNLGLYGPGYAFIGKDWTDVTNPIWPGASDEDIPRIKEASYGSIGVVPSAKPSDKLDAWIADYLVESDYVDEASEISTWAPFASDAILVLAYGIDYMIKNYGHPYSLGVDNSFDLDALTHWRDLLRQTMFNDTNIEGFAGDIVFDENGDRLPFYSIINLQGNGEVWVGPFATYELLTEELTIMDDVEVIWPGEQSEAPDGAKPPDVIYVDYNDIGAIVALVFCMILLAVSLIVLVLLVVFINKSPFKLTGRAWNITLIVAIIFSACTIFAFIGKPNDEMCTIRIWMFLPYTLVLASLVGKVVAALFFQIKAKSNDELFASIQWPWWQYALFCAAVLAVETLYLILWVSFFPTTATEILFWEGRFPFITLETQRNQIMTNF